MFYTKPCLNLLAALALMGFAYSADALEFRYDGEIFFCTTTCNSFGALGGATGGSNNTVNSLITGTIDIAPEADGSFSFTAADSVPFSFDVSSTAIPLEDPVLGPSPTCPPPNEEGQLCNATTVNPLSVSNSTAVVSGSGQLTPNGSIISGSLTFVFTVAPFSNNGAVIVIDMMSGDGVGTVFGGAVTFFRAAGTLSVANDADDDGILDGLDNCVDAANPAQIDSNGDGFGNACDADLNNDCIVNISDLGLLRSVFFAPDEDADFNGDGTVNVVDLGILRSRFFAPPGPSGTQPVCTSQLGPFGRAMFVRGAFTDDSGTQFNLDHPLEYAGGGQFSTTLVIDRTAGPPIEFLIDFKVADNGFNDGHNCGVGEGVAAVALGQPLQLVCSSADNGGVEPGNATLNLLAQPQPAAYLFEVDAALFPGVPPTVTMRRAP